MRGIEQCQQIVAKEYGIPMVVSGGGNRITYLEIPEVFQGGDPAFFSNVVNGTIFETKAKSMFPVKNMWNISRLLRLTNKLSRKIIHRYVINAQAAQPAYLIHIFDYFAPSPEDILHTLKTEMGWQGPEGEVEHMDCKLHHIAAFIRQLKFPEVTDTTFYHSGLIRRGLMTREEALLIEEENLYDKEIPDELEYFLKEIGMTKEEFKFAVSDWRKVEQYRETKTQKALTSLLERIKNA